MIGFACEVAATTARTARPGADRRVARGATPAGRRRRRPARRPADVAEEALVSGPELTVGRGVIAELVRLAALEVPGVARVGRGGPAWRPAPRRPRGLASASATTASSSASGSSPGRARRSAPLDRARSGRPSPRPSSACSGLELGAVTVLVDGVGG